MAKAEDSGCAPSRAPQKFTPRQRFIVGFTRTLTAARRLRADLPTDDPGIKAAFRDWVTQGEVVAILMAARG